MTIGSDAISAVGRSNGALLCSIVGRGGISSAPHPKEEGHER